MVQLGNVGYQALVTEKYNTSRESHRVRSRRADPASPDSDVLQAVFGFAYTIQQEIQKLRRETNALFNSFSPQVNLQPGFPPALGRIVASAQNLTAATGAAIGIGSAQSMICIARSGSTAPNIGSRFDGRSGLGGECVRTRQTVICVNAAADPRVDYNACAALGVRSMVYLPLLLNEKLIGVMAVFSSKAQHFSAQDLNCLRWAQALVVESLNGSGTQVGAGSLIPELTHPQADSPHEISAFTTVEPTPTPQAEVAIPVLSPEPQAVPRLEPTFVGTIVDDSALELGPEIEQPKERNRLPIIIAIVLILIFGTGAGLMVFQRVRRANLAKQITSNAQVTPSSPTGSEPPSEPTNLPQADEPPANASLKPAAVLPSSVQFKSDRAHAALNIALLDSVSYEGFSINAPNRVYFDLHGVNLVGPEGASIDVTNDIISRVRISAFRPGITRIVFDLNGDKPFLVKAYQGVNSVTFALDASTPDNPEAITPKAGQVVKITSAGTEILSVSQPPQTN
jgi:hypothetical protein